jgi:hypothetical protein
MIDASDILLKTATPKAIGIKVISAKEWKETQGNLKGADLAWAHEFYSMSQAKR